MNAAAIWFVVARLCFPFPQSPEGFACLTHHYVWYEGESPTIEDAGHPLYHWRDIEMTRVPIPGIKPEPTSERPRDAVVRVRR